MKKILLTILITSSFVANAQFWFIKDTSFATVGRTLSSISIVDTSNIWAIGLDCFTPIDYTIKEFTKSTNGGETWSSGTINLGANTSGLGITSISAISDQIAWISAAPVVSDLGGIWKTTDGGLNWTKQPTALFLNPTNSYTNFVHFWDANNGVAQGNPESNEFEIYTTNNGGTTWTRVLGVNIPDPLRIGDEFGYFNRYSFSGNTIWFGTDQGRIFKSSDKGLTWTVNINPTPSIDFASDNFTFSDENKGLLAKYNLDQTATLYSTNDGGTNWIPVISSGTIFKDHIIYIPGTSIIVSAGKGVINPYAGVNFGSSYSSNDGVKWFTIDEGSFHGTLAFLNTTFGFSAGLQVNGTDGGIHKFIGNFLKTPDFDVEKQISAYPNPTNGILKLHSEISLIKEASVFDLLGRQVYSSKFSGLNNVTLDLKSLQTGSYVLKVTSDSGKIESMKIIKTKF